MSTSVSLTHYRADIAIARAILKTHGVNALLAAPESNPKIAKGSKIGVLTSPMHLAPASLSGFNVCPMATPGCIKACLHTAGNPVYMNGKTKARVARTLAYFKARDAFMRTLAAEIAAHERKAIAANMVCGVRLNATSDIPWESVSVTFGDKTWPNLMSLFPEITFYDYTARHNRKNLPANYTLTYSLKENNDARAIEAMANGMNVAAVFSVIRGHALPQFMAVDGGKLRAEHSADSWINAISVIDGDLHDFRPNDPRGVIVGLRAKGKAIGDTSGFVHAA